MAQVSATRSPAVEIADLRMALRDLQSWVKHWQDDVAANLKPTPDSLRSAEIRIKAVLAGERE